MSLELLMIRQMRLYCVYLLTFYLHTHSHPQAQQPSDEQPQLEEPPTEGQDIIPAQDIDDEGAPTVQGERRENKSACVSRVDGHVFVHREV